MKKASDDTKNQLRNSLLLTSKIVETREISFNIRLNKTAMQLAEPLAIKSYNRKHYEKVFENFDLDKEMTSLIPENFSTKGQLSEAFDPSEGTEGVLIKYRYDFLSDMFDKNMEWTSKRKGFADQKVFESARAWINLPVHGSDESKVYFLQKTDDNYLTKAVGMQVKLPDKTVNNKSVDTNMTTTKQSDFMQKIYASWQEESDLSVMVTSKHIEQEYLADPKYKYKLPSDESFYAGKGSAKESFV